MRNVLLLCAVAISSIATAYAQRTDDVINTREAGRIETILASDAMQGRQAGTPAIQKAADFIAAEFKKAGLQPLQDNSYLQKFAMQAPELISISGEVNGEKLQPQHIIAVSQQPELNLTEKSGYAVTYIKAGDNIGTAVRTAMADKQNKVVVLDPSFGNMFPRLKGFQRPSFASGNEANTIFLLSPGELKTFSITVKQRIDQQPYANVVGLLPGKSKKTEYVIFSAHYDHLGIGKPVNGDSIYNGANDDAAGTTAVIMLANYFKQLGNNERTIVFAAFTAEEIGGFGSQYFSKQFNPDQVVAMFNIEMIGTESKWGKASAYITGYDKSDMGRMLQQNLQGTNFTFHPDPYPEQNLFYRSDNATLARLGVPAHTISTAKMDAEPYYHSPGDEVQTLDMANMAEIIKAIAISSKSIVSGADTPTRVAPASLK